MRSKETGKALLLAMAGFSMLTVGDSIAKSLGGAWPGTAVAALRYAFGAAGLVVAVALVRGKAGFVMPRPWLQIGRGASVSVATLCFFMGVMAMPLADATSIQFTAPMLTVIFSALFLHERLPKAAIGAVVLAFAGVLVVLRPNLLELGAAAFWPLGGAFGMAMLMILNRKAAGSAPALVMQLLVAGIAAPILTAAAVLLHLSEWREFAVPVPTVGMVLKCLTIAFTGTVGHLLIYSATTRVSAALVSPMTYVQLLVAAAIGWFWFQDAPDLGTFGGAALIIAGGLLLWRSQRTPDLGGAPD